MQIGMEGLRHSGCQFIDQAETPQAYYSCNNVTQHCAEMNFQTLHCIFKQKEEKKNQSLEKKDECEVI